MTAAEENVAGQYLDLLEGIAQINHVLDTAKTDLVARGWDERMAEHASIATVGAMIAGAAAKASRE